MYRIAAVLVVLFWAAMWALLINAELSPQGGLVRRVPVELVLKQALQHRQASHLFIYQGQERLGHIRIAPQVDDQSGQRRLEFFGNFQLSWPGIPPQRIIWDAVMDLNAELGLEAARGTVGVRLLNVRNSATTRLEWQANPQTQQGQFRLVADDVVVEDQNLSLSRDGLQELLRRYGTDASWLPAFQSNSVAPQTEVLAQRSRIDIKGQEIEAYAITLRHNGQTLMEAKVSELGQVLEATTLVGWTLRAE